MKVSLSLRIKNRVVEKVKSHYPLIFRIKNELSSLKWISESFWDFPSLNCFSLWLCWFNFFSLNTLYEQFVSLLLLNVSNLLNLFSVVFKNYTSIFTRNNAEKFSLTLLFSIFKRNFTSGVWKARRLLRDGEKWVIQYWLSNLRRLFFALGHSEL